VNNDKLVGKLVNDRLYLHYRARSYLPRELAERIDAAEVVLDNEFPDSQTPGWNVIRVHLRWNQVAFLHYPGFRSIAHPVLRKSYSVGRQSKYQPVVMTVTCYDPASPSASILHRKEAFLPREDDDFGLFSTLTSQEEAAGLFKNPSIIGLKDCWEGLLRKHHLTIDHHVLYYRGKPATAKDCQKVRARVR